MTHRFLAALVTAASVMVPGPARAAEPARDMYNRALVREREVRDEATKPTPAQMRRAVASYEAVVRKHPVSGYCDNALWQGANLAALAYERFGNELDRKTAVRLFALLTKEYPTSKLAARAAEALNGLNAPVAASPSASAPSVPPAVAPARPRPDPVAALPDVNPASGAAAAPAARKAPASIPGAPATLREIRRSVLPDGIRLTVDLDAEVAYHQEEIENPRRLFFDLKGVKAAPSLQDVSLKFDDDVVKEVRLGRHPQNTTRLVVDLNGVSSYTVYPCTVRSAW